MTNSHTREVQKEGHPFHRVVGLVACANPWHGPEKSSGTAKLLSKLRVASLQCHCR